MSTVSKKRRFSGTPAHVKRQKEAQRQQEAEEDGRKFVPPPDEWHALTLAPPSFQETPEGYRLIDLEHLFAVIKSAFVCKACKSDRLTFAEDESQRKGWSSALRFYCRSCRATTNFQSSKKCESAGNSFEVNRRAAVASAVMGSSRQELVKFSAVFNMPPPSLPDSWECHVNKINSALTGVFSESAIAAVSHYRRKKELGDGEGIDDVRVSFDGTWSKRGHSSHYGLQAVILHDVGAIVDFNVYSTLCRRCSLMAAKNPDKDSPEYALWAENHAPSCTKNFNRSANAMEADGALLLWKRSIDKHRLRYTKFVGDGDSKSFNVVSKPQVYGVDHPVQKEDCIGHLQKRMGGRLRKWKKEHKGYICEDGKGVGGAHRLTDEVIDRIQKYYGYAIRRNVGDAASMVLETKAILHHMTQLCGNEEKIKEWEGKAAALAGEGRKVLHYSHDLCPKTEEDRHRFCPVGAESWCKWQADRANADEPGYVAKYNPEASAKLPHVFLHALKDIIDQLSDRDLLQRCEEGNTQNANESFHSVLLTFAPKEKFRGKLPLSVAAKLAASYYNHGTIAFRRLISVLDLDIGKHSFRICQSIDEEREYHQTMRGKEWWKRNRQIKRSDKRRVKDTQETAEGVTYEAGAFGGVHEEPERPSASREKKKATKRKQGNTLDEPDDSPAERRVLPSRSRTPSVRLVESMACESMACDYDVRELVYDLEEYYL